MPLQLSFTGFFHFRATLVISSILRKTSHTRLFLLAAQPSGSSSTLFNAFQQLFCHDPLAQSLARYSPQAPIGIHIHPTRQCLSNSLSWEPFISRRLRHVVYPSANVTHSLTLFAFLRLLFDTLILFNRYFLKTFSLQSLAQYSPQARISNLVHSVRQGLSKSIRHRVVMVPSLCFAFSVSQFLSKVLQSFLFHSKSTGENTQKIARTINV